MEKQPTTRPVPKSAGKSKKWQKMFRYTAERENAIKELVIFVHLVDELIKQSAVSPDSIRDRKGRKIYL
jgi:hypothetical protein